MNAGHDYTRAKRHAQANADRAQAPRWLHLYNRAWWIESTPIPGAERIEPDPAVRPVAPMRDVATALFDALADLTERCDGDEGVRADGSNIQTHAAHAAIELGERAGLERFRKP